MAENFETIAIKAITNANFLTEVHHGDFIEVTVVKRRHSICEHNTGELGDVSKKPASVVGAACGKNAKYKAVFEAIERDCLHHGYRVDAKAAAVDLQFAIGANILAPLSAEQISKLKHYYPNFQGYSDNLELDWTRGVNCYGEEVYIPSELVYYGDYRNNFRNKIYYANSSGTAAHIDFKQAKDGAFSELIERDAMMRLCLSHKSPKIVPDELLPKKIKSQKELIERCGLKITVLDLTPLAYYNVPTFLVTIRNKISEPYFVCGSASNFTSANSAMEKAMEEALHTFTYFYESRSFFHKLNSRQVRTPWEHGLWYANSRKHAKSLSWLFDGQKSKGNWYSSQDPAVLMKASDALSVDLTPKKPFDDIKVARVFSPILIPISFGINQLHYLKYNEVTKEFANKSAISNPHFFT